MAFDNLRMFQALVGAAGPVRFEIEVRSYHHPADQSIGWHSPYRAHIVAICR